MMRLTFDLDDDLARAVQERAAEQAISFDEALHRLLRRAVTGEPPGPTDEPLFHVIQGLFVRERLHPRSTR